MLLWRGYISDIQVMEKEGQYIVIFSAVPLLSGQFSPKSSQNTPIAQGMDKRHQLPVKFCPIAAVLYTI